MSYCANKDIQLKSNCDCNALEGISDCCRLDPCSSNSSRVGLSSKSLQYLSWWPGRSCLRSTLQSAGAFPVAPHTCMLLWTDIVKLREPCTHFCCFKHSHNTVRHDSHYVGDCSQC